MKIVFVAFSALCASSGVTLAQTSKDSSWLPEPGLVTAQKSVTNLEVGGKRMAAKAGEKLAQGAACRIGANTVVRKVGEEKDGRVIVRVFLLSLVQTDPAYCPQGTPFHLSLDEWANAKNAFDKKYSFQEYWEMIRGKR